MSIRKKENGKYELIFLNSWKEGDEVTPHKSLVRMETNVGLDGALEYYTAFVGKRDRQILKIVMDNTTDKEQNKTWLRADSFD